MTLISKALRVFVKDESGATAIEYGLFAALVGAVIVGSVALLGEETKGGFQSMNSAMSDPAAAAATARSEIGG